MTLNQMIQTSYTHEFAFQLLGDVCGKTIVDLGSGDRISKLALASQGADVISVDITRHERIPVVDGGAHGVLCNSVLRHADAVAIARQIRRVLKPGGVAVFHEPESEPFPFDQVGAVSRAVGKPGRTQLGLTLRLLHNAEIRDLRMVRVAQRVDNWLLGKVPFLQKIAATLGGKRGRKARARFCGSAFSDFGIAHSATSIRDPQKQFSKAMQSIQLLMKHCCRC